MEALKTTEFLHRLMEINNDRLKTYEMASMQVKELEWKLLFSRFTQTSKRCNDELNAEMLNTGGNPVGITKNPDQLINFWMEVSAALIGNDKQMIIQSCESAENNILETYQLLIQNERGNFSERQYALIQEQHALIQSDFDEIILWKNRYSA